MSLSQEQSGLRNPCSKFLRFKNGVFSYYDKEKKENVEVDLSKGFYVLKELTAVTGFDEANMCGIFSNEVEWHDDLIQVRSFKGGEIAFGVYNEIKDKCASKGCKYTKSVYIADDKGDLLNLQLKGAAFGGWLDKPKESRFKFSKCEDGKKGAVTYKIPVFEALPEDDKKKEVALKVLNETLLPYLDEYCEKNRKELNGKMGLTETTMPEGDGGITEDLQKRKEEVKNDVDEDALPF